MTALLAGIDFSSKALDACLIPLDPADTSVPPVTFRRFELPVFKAGAMTSQYRSVVRCSEVARIISTYGSTFGFQRFVGPVSCVWVEEPQGGRRDNATNVMRELYGALLASIPPHIAVSTITPAQWRKHHGLANGKEVARGCAMRFVPLATWNELGGISEHQADALLVALAGRDLEHSGRAA